MHNGLKIQFSLAVQNFLGKKPICSQVYNYTDADSAFYYEMQQRLLEQGFTRPPSHTFGSLFLLASPLDRTGSHYALTEMDTYRSYINLPNHVMSRVRTNDFKNADGQSIFTIDEVKVRMAEYETSMDQKCEQSIATNIREFGLTFRRMSVGDFETGPSSAYSYSKSAFTQELLKKYQLA